MNTNSNFGDDDYSDLENENGGNQPHDLTLGDICTVTGGRDAGKTVLVIKAGIQTKYGVKAITVEYTGPKRAGSMKLWIKPEELAYNGTQDVDTASAIKEADYQEWKAKKQAGMADMPAQKPWQQKSTYFKKKEASEEEADPFR